MDKVLEPSTQGESLSAPYNVYIAEAYQSNRKNTEIKTIQNVACLVTGTSPHTT